jgi:hypothetical protein
VPLLSKAEKDYLLGKREFTTKDQGYYIKSRILKKIKMLYGIELPLLERAGFLAACRKDLAASCKTSPLNNIHEDASSESLPLNNNDTNPLSATHTIRQWQSHNAR